MPVVIEALQIPAPWHENARAGAELEQWMTNGGCKYAIHPDASVYILTLEGQMKASPGDYIIKGVKGEFYPCKPDIFHATYEPV